MRATWTVKATPVLACLVLMQVSGMATASPETSVVSVSSKETRANDSSRDPAASGGGRFVAFSSAATNLVANDTNRVRDVFVRDRQAGTTRRVSVSSAGVQGNKASFDPTISADGRVVAFVSSASNLVAKDTNGAKDVFVRNLATGTTARVSVSSKGAQGNKASFDPVLSADGMRVAFVSHATNLNRKKDTNKKSDVFVRDRKKARTSRVSVSWKGSQANGRSYQPAISEGGRHVAFTSGGGNLAKGGDTNKKFDVFVRDRKKARTYRVSVSWKGSQAKGRSRQPSISANGRYVAFASGASNLNKGEDTNRRTDIFLRDRSRRKTIRVSVTWRGKQSNGDSFGPAISADGKMIAFASGAKNLIRAKDSNGQKDVFVRDRSRRTTLRASVPARARQANKGSAEPTISANGRFAAFASPASNLIGSDGNRRSDIFLRGPIGASRAADPVIAASGDIACDPAHPHYNGGNGTADKCRHKYTSNLLVNKGLAKVVTVGDNQYEEGSLSDFRKSYDPTWGRVKSITRPSVGNHEYQLAGASGYFDYFGAAAGPRGKGYYSFDVGSWHLIALNSNCTKVACGVGSAQEKWLKADLANHRNKCTLAYWHHPRWSSSFGGNTTAVSAFWSALYNAGADVVLNGHSHVYERFAPQNPSGKLDTARGIREFIVGTGGASHAKFATTQPNSQVRNATTYGVLRLALHPSSYDWKFVPEAGKSFTDSGSGTCH